MDVSGSFFQQPQVSSTTTVSSSSAVQQSPEIQALMDELTPEEQEKMRADFACQQQQRLQQKLALANVGTREEFEAKEARVRDIQRKTERAYLSNPENRSKRKEIDYRIATACMKSLVPDDQQIIDAFWNHIECNPADFSVSRELFSHASLRFFNSIKTTRFDEAISLEKVTKEIRANKANLNEALIDYCLLKVKYILPAFLCHKARAKWREDKCESDKARCAFRVQYKAQHEAYLAQRIQSLEEDMAQYEKMVNEHFQKYDATNPLTQKWISAPREAAEECKRQIAALGTEDVDAWVETVVNNQMPPLQEVSLPKETDFEQIAFKVLILEDEAFDSSLLLPSAMQLAETSLTCAYFMTELQRKDDEKRALVG